MSDLTGVVPGPSEIAGLFDWSTALETLRMLGTDVAAAPSVADACFAIQQVLAGNPSDIPFAALYLLDDRHNLVRMSATGVVPDGRQLPTAVSVDENTGPWPFASVIRTKQSADVSQAVVLPIRGTPEQLAGVFVAGVNPRRPLDQSYRAFFDLVAGQIAAALASARANERERTLQSISTRLISESKQESLFEQLLDAALELMGADSASIQMLEPDQKSLTLIGWRNMHPDSVAFWRHVSLASATSCSHALRDHARVVIPDIETCDFMAGTDDLRESRRSGVRSVQSTPLQSRSGALLGMISTHWRTPHTPTDDDFRLFDVLARQAADLIERTRAEAAVRESEEWFRLMASSAPVTIWMTDVDKECTYVNQAWLDFTGRPLEAALGKGWTDGMHPDDVERSWSTYAKAFDRHEPFQMEYRVRRHDGEFRCVIDTGVPRWKSDGSFAGYIGSAVDVTERRLAQEALSTVSQRLIDAQEEERKRLARELHDDISQRLGLLSLRLSEVTQAFLKPGEDVNRLLSLTRGEVANLVKDVHDLSHRLHPPRLEILGLAAAADALCDEFSSPMTMEVHFQSEGIPKRLPSRISLCLYRVLQEALQNAAKHSGARHVDVSLKAHADKIELIVEDTGRGFNVDEAARTRGLGLSSMKERIKGVHGQLVVDSEPQRGTAIRARVPYSGRAS